MTTAADDLTAALETLEWGSTQPDMSASLTPAMCRALLEYIAELERSDETLNNARL
jgi:hypothetical protein